MQQTGHLHKILPTLSRKTTVYILQYSPPAAWSIRKFKGLPLLLDQAVLSLPLSQTWPWWHHFLIHKWSEVDRCSLSVFLEQKSQPRKSSSKTSQLPSVQLGQYSCPTSLLRASHDEHKMTQMNIAGRRGILLSKVISLLKADVWTKCYFLLCIKRASTSDVRKENECQPSAMHTCWIPRIYSCHVTPSKARGLSAWGQKPLGRSLIHLCTPNLCK